MCATFDGNRLDGRFRRAFLPESLVLSVEIVLNSGTHALNEFAIVLRRRERELEGVGGASVLIGGWIR